MSGTVQEKEKMDRVEGASREDDLDEPDTVGLNLSERPGLCGDFACRS